MRHSVFSWSMPAARVVLLVSLLSAPGVAQTITFRKIADESTPVPGGTGTFTGFVSTPVIDRGNVAFEGSAGNPGHGIYTDIGGTLRPVVTTNTPGPDGSGTFGGFFEPSIDDGRVAFRGRVRLGNSFLSRGVYLESSGVISVVAVIGMPAPGGGAFSFFESNEFARPSLNANRVAFAALTTEGGFGVYVLEADGTLSLVANGNTLVPGSSTPFQFVGAPFLSGPNIVFAGFSGPPSTVKGIYARIGGGFRVIADNTMMAPGGTTTFYGPVNPVIDGEDIAFIDLGSVPSPNAQQGSYTYFDGVLDIGILGSPVAGGPSLQNRALVANRGPGIISTNFGGSEFRVIGSGDVLDGKSLSLAYQSREAISGNEIVFFALFDDGTQGIYVATIEGFCGNQVVEGGESCDDGNTVNDDGCSATCQLEPVAVIPTVSGWGLVILTLLLCVMGRLRFGLRASAH